MTSWAGKRRRDRTLLLRLNVQFTETNSHHGLNTFKQGVEATGSDKRGGMKPLYAHDSVQEIPPSLVWKVFTSGCAPFPLTTRGWKLARGTWNEISESCSRLTGNDGAGMRGETVRRTRHFYAHEGKNWSRVGPNRCWLPSSELKICLQIVVDKQKDGIIHKFGRQSLDNVRPRHLLRTGKNTCCPNVGLELSLE